MKAAPWSEWIKDGMPKMDKILYRHVMTVSGVSSAQRLAKGNQECSTAMVRIYLILETVGRGV